MCAESSMTSENYISEEKNDYKTDTEESDDVSMEQYPPLCMWRFYLLVRGRKYVC